jgi:hypothetical protein
VAAARLGVKIAGRQARRNPERAAAKVAADLPPVDAAIMREPQNWAIHQHSLSELLAHPAAVTGEIARLVRPWGIDYAAISATRSIRPPTHVGSPSCCMTRPCRSCRGAATFGLSRHYADALAFAASHGTRTGDSSGFLG